jgi:poly(3-hydroxybutyrate) depolymerase
MQEIPQEIFVTRFAVFFLVLCVLWAPVHALRESPSERMTMTHDGVERYYTLHVPPRVLGSKKKVPLVLMLHGGGGNDSNGVKMSQFSKKADQEGFIVAYPSGSGRFRKILKPGISGIAAVMRWRIIQTMRDFSVRLSIILLKTIPSIPTGFW